MSREHKMGCNTRFLIHLNMEITFTAPSDHQTTKKEWQKMRSLVYSKTDQNEVSLLLKAGQISSKGFQIDFIQRENWFLLPIDK